MTFKDVSKENSIPSIPSLWYWLNHEILCAVKTEWLWLNDGIWQHRSMSKLAQVMVCCLKAQRYYRNQYWFLLSIYGIRPKAKLFHSEPLRVDVVSDFLIWLAVNIAVNKIDIKRVRYHLSRGRITIFWSLWRHRQSIVTSSAECTASEWDTGMMCEDPCFSVIFGCVMSCKK